jgi:hypothetical protein
VASADEDGEHRTNHLRDHAEKRSTGGCGSRAIRCRRSRRSGFEALCEEAIGLNGQLERKRAILLRSYYTDLTTEERDEYDALSRVGDSSLFCKRKLVDSWPEKSRRLVDERLQAAANEPVIAAKPISSTVRDAICRSSPTSV